MLLPFPGPILEEDIFACNRRLEVFMQDGSVIRRNRKKHSDIWQFHWWEKTSDGKRIYQRRQIGTVDQIPDLETARKAARLLVSDLNARMAKSKSASMTIAQLCSHFEQCELSLANTWRSYSTKTIYKVYLRPIARITCAKIRNVMSVLFNHAGRYEFFVGDPIRLVRQSAKRRSPPVVLTAGEIRILLERLKVRERTLVS
jgi:integrase